MGAVFRESKKSDTNRRRGSAGSGYGQDKSRNQEFDGRALADAASATQGQEGGEKQESQEAFSEEKLALAAATLRDLCELSEVKITLPNSAGLRNIPHFLRSLDVSDPSSFELSLHPKWVAVHPAVLALTACAAQYVKSNGGTITGNIPKIKSLPYLIRMKLFDFIPLKLPTEITEHEESGRFIPLTQIKNTEDLRNAIANLVPLLHAPPQVAEPIKYVFSEMVRNVLEHSRSPVGAFVAAQYYAETKRIAIGIADAGIGIYEHLRQFHDVANPTQAILLALRPGITGTTSKLGGTEFNAGAGLYFTKSIAAASRNYFILYSGSSAYRLMQGPSNRTIEFHTDPEKDVHKLLASIPAWPGTVVGIDLNVSDDTQFADLLDKIRRSYFFDTKKRKKDYAHRIIFS